MLAEQAATSRYLRTQLPFAYVHLLTLLVSLNTQVVSIKCGAIIGREYLSGEMNYITVAVQIVPRLLLLVLFGATH